ncbi:hypothetical protein SKAU_G00254780 [Synaphobranchus kaupii]|uniref:Cytidine and dCMP deaminase domain-containing protein 1 n=1 Tax=Synaphobranchus kaupii TaxID=118154 RepID=A0A9Q1IRY6_SYNKA|nr:hypothetical protein SKAU_G00254780 [Synaphobranchus kaupii]
MATTDTSHVKRNREESSVVCSCKCERRDASTQTDTKVQGHGPRLSKVNLFTLLSLWMELFPRNKSQLKNATEQARATGLVVVQDRNVIGLHCSSTELHVGQVAVIKHGPRLKGCNLYFSRKPCSTCLKMIVNAGANRVSYWPGDPELSLLSSDGGGSGVADRQAPAGSQDAVLDAVAAERLKSNSRPHVCVLLQPLSSTMQQFAAETSGGCDFVQRVAADDRRLDAGELFASQRRRSLERLTAAFFVPGERQHRDILALMGLETFCVEPYFSNLRQHMRDLIGVLASVASSIPDLPLGYGFYAKDLAEGPAQGLSQDVSRHCIIQAQLLAYRTEDPKVGVGAVIWAHGKSGHCDGTGRMYLVGCGYNAYPAGSEYAEFPQMDTTQEDRQHRKYRYILHAEQSALIFRSAEIKEDENTMLFVSKCPCDECVPLIVGAGIKQVYTTDLDSGKDKHDISYLKFEHLQGVQKFIWQRKVQAGDVSEPSKHPLSNGSVRKCETGTEEGRCNKKPRL